MASASPIIDYNPKSTLLLSPIIIHPNANATIVSTLRGRYYHLHEGPHTLLTVVLLTCTALLLIACTLIGNTLVCLSVLLVRKLRNQPANYLLISLAVADLCVGCFVMPLAFLDLILGKWPFGQLMCDVWTSADVTLCTASILNLCAISVDRYSAITRPLTYVPKRTSKLILAYVVAVWLGAVLVSFLPPIAFSKAHENQTCIVNQMWGYQIYATMVSFYIPATIILVVNYKIYKAARQMTLKDKQASQFSTPTTATTTCPGRSPTVLVLSARPVTDKHLFNDEEEEEILTSTVSTVRHTVSQFSLGNLGTDASTSSQFYSDNRRISFWTTDKELIDDSKKTAPIRTDSRDCEESVIKSDNGAAAIRNDHGDKEESFIKSDQTDKKELSTKNYCDDNVKILISNKKWKDLRLSDTGQKKDTFQGNTDKPRVSLPLTSDKQQERPFFLGEKLINDRTNAATRVTDNKINGTDKNNRLQQIDQDDKKEASSADTKKTPRHLSWTTHQNRKLSKTEYIDKGMARWTKRSFDQNYLLSSDHPIAEHYSPPVQSIIFKTYKTHQDVDSRLLCKKKDSLSADKNLETQLTITDKETRAQLDLKKQLVITDKTLDNQDVADKRLKQQFCVTDKTMEQRSGVTDQDGQSTGDTNRDKQSEKSFSISISYHFDYSNVDNRYVHPLPRRSPSLFANYRLYARSIIDRFIDFLTYCRYRRRSRSSRPDSCCQKRFSKLQHSETSATPGEYSPKPRVTLIQNGAEKSPKKCKICQSQKSRGRRRKGKREQSHSSETRAMKTLGVIMGCFLLCWIPFFLVALIKALFSDKIDVPWWLESLVLWLGYANSTLNPILYAKYNKDFRIPFREMLLCRFRTLQSVLRMEDYLDTFGGGGSMRGNSDDNLGMHSRDNNSSRFSPSSGLLSGRGEQSGMISSRSISTALLSGTEELARDISL